MTADKAKTLSMLLNNFVEEGKIASFVGDF